MRRLGSTPSRRWRPLLLVAASLGGLAGIGLGSPVAAAEEPCELVDTASVGRLLGPVGTAQEVSVDGLSACRIPVGSLTLEVIDGSSAGGGEYEAQLARHGVGDRQEVADYVDGAFFGWGVGEATDFVARRGDQVTILRLTGQDRSGSFDAADPTASAPDGDVSGSEVGSSLWVLMTEAFAGADGVEAPEAGDLSGLWRTTDITPCAPQSDLGVRVSEFDDDDGDLVSTKVAGDSCLDDGLVDFQGVTVDGAGTGTSFASVGSSTPGAGTAYELTIDSPTEVTLTGAAGALQYTLVYERLSWPGLAVTETTSSLLGIPSPSDAITARNVALTGAVSGLLLLIVVLPTTLFNSALEANLDHYRALGARITGRVRGWFTRGGGGGAGPPGPEGDGEAGGRSFWNRPRGVVAYLLLAGLLFSLMQPGWGANSATVISLIGFTGGVVVTSLLGVIATVVYLLLGRRPGRGRPVVSPGTLLVAAVFVLASRLVGFVPGYLYGVLVVWASVHEPDDDEHGRIVAFASALTLVGAVGAWFLIPWLRDVAGPEPGVLAAAPLSIVSGVFVANVELLAIGLIPLRFLPGHALRAFNKQTWAILWAGSGVLFVLVLLRPGLVSGRSQHVTGTIGLVVASSLFALGFWLYETRRNRVPPAVPPAAPGPGAPPDAPLRAGTPF